MKREKYQSGQMIENCDKNEFKKISSDIQEGKVEILLTNLKTDGTQCII